MRPGACSCSRARCGDGNRTEACRDAHTDAAAAEDVADRLSVSVTLLLTAVAFKLVTSTMTPAVAYLTLLDRYVGVSSIIIFLAVGAAAVAGEINATFDRAAAWSLLGLWAVLHFWFAARVLAAQAGYSAHSRRPASVRNSVRC